jgi:hypothetical protein
MVGGSAIPKLVAAVSNPNGLGSLGTAYLPTGEAAGAGEIVPALRRSRTPRQETGHGGPPVSLVTIRRGWRRRKGAAGDDPVSGVLDVWGSEAPTNTSSHPP